MTLLRRERDSNRRSLSSESARARLAAGGNGIRTVSPSPVRVGLFAACGKFAAWLDLFMTPWWSKGDSNRWSLSRAYRLISRDGERRKSIRMGCYGADRDTSAE